DGLGLQGIDVGVTAVSFAVLVPILGLRGAAVAVTIAAVLAITTVAGIESLVVLVALGAPGARVALGAVRGLVRVTLRSEIVPLIVIAVVVALLTGTLAELPRVLGAPRLPETVASLPFVNRLAYETTTDLPGHFGATLAAYAVLGFLRRALDYFGFRVALRSPTLAAEADG